MIDQSLEQKARELVEEKRAFFARCEDALSLALIHRERAASECSDAEHKYRTILKKKGKAQ